jgi:hypothetical protein
VGSGNHHGFDSEPGGELGPGPRQRVVVFAEEVPAGDAEGGHVRDVERVQEVGAGVRDQQFREQALGILASLVGAKTVTPSALFSESTSSACLSAATSVDSTGLPLAAVATGTFVIAIAVKLPGSAVSVGTAAQPGPNSPPIIAGPLVAIGGELVAGALPASSAESPAQASSARIGPDPNSSGRAVRSEPDRGEDQAHPEAGQVVGLVRRDEGGGRTDQEQPAAKSTR